MTGCQHPEELRLSLSDYGSADEVWEIAEELDFEDSAFAAKFLERAFSAGVRFTPEQVLEMVAMVDQSLLSKMAEQTTVPSTGSNWKRST